MWGLGCMEIFGIVVLCGFDRRVVFSSLFTAFIVGIGFRRMISYVIMI